jgi:hypothetical protein
LRVDPAKNAQRRRIRPAEPYLIGRVDLITQETQRISAKSSARRVGLARRLGDSDLVGGSPEP